MIGGKQGGAIDRAKTGSHVHQHDIGHALPRGLGESHVEKTQSPGSLKIYARSRQPLVELVFELVERQISRQETDPAEFNYFRFPIRER